MRGPVCEVCAKTGVLCPSCQGKKERGEITDTDVLVAKALYELDDSLHFGDMELIRAVDAGRMDFVFVRGKTSRLFENMRFVAKELRWRLKKPVLILDLNDPFEAARRILGRVRVIGTARVFSPEGVKYRVYVRKRDYARRRVQRIAHILREVTGGTLEIEGI